MVLTAGTHIAASELHDLSDGRRAVACVVIAGDLSRGLAQTTRVGTR